MGIEQTGPRLTVKHPTPAVRKLVADLLTYPYREHLRGQAARVFGSSVRVRDTECFAYLEDPDRLLAPRLVFAAGYLQRVARSLRAAGYRVLYRDSRPHPRPEVFDPCWERIEGFELRHRQREVLEKVVAARTGRVVCATAYGKSLLLSLLCRLWPGARVDVATHSCDVVDMLYADLSRHLPDVGLVTGSRRSNPRARVRCFSGKSVHRTDGKADVLLVDEVHEWGSPDYLERALKYYPGARRYGFSANRPGDRPDGADFEIEGAFGPVLVDVPYDEAREHGCVAEVRVRWEDVLLDRNPVAGVDDPVQRMRHGVWRNDVRNRGVAAAARDYPDQQVLVVVATVEHACRLKALLPEFTLCYDQAGLDTERRRAYVAQGLIPADLPVMTRELRLDIKRRFETGELRKVIATSVWNRGVNFRQLSVLVRAEAQNTPIADTQIPGRVARLSPDKPYGLVVDFCDQFDRSFRRRAEDRRRRYAGMGWTQFYGKEGRHAPLP